MSAFRPSSILPVLDDLLSPLLSSGDNTRDVFELRAGPLVGRELRVIAFTGREAISELYSFEIVVASKLHPDLVRVSVLGQPACFSMQGEHDRDIYGRIAAVETIGAEAADGWVRYRIRLLPRLAGLDHRTNCRVFQHMSVSNIVETILEEHDIPFRWMITRSLPIREYCVQYNETDLAFVMRILSEEGVYFYFDQPSGMLAQLLGPALLAASAVAGAAVATVDAVQALSGQGESAHASASIFDTLGLCDQVVFSDTYNYPTIGFNLATSLAQAIVAVSGTGTVSSLPPLLSQPTPVRYCDAEGMNAASEHVYQFSRTRTVETKSVVVESCDPTSPRNKLSVRSTTPLFDSLLTGSPLGLAATAVAAVAGVGAPPPLDVSAVGVDQKRSEHYEYGRLGRADTEGRRASRLREAYRREARTGEGRSTHRAMAAGYTFALADYELDGDMHAYLVTEIVHEGTSPEMLSFSQTRVERVYENQFRTVPANVIYRPLPMTRTSPQFVDTATVVGRPDGGVDTDSLGRVRVQFHWDRDAEPHSASSCYISVAQSWAGPHFGVQFVPRPGMEVVVLFLLGDLDRPIITGCLPSDTCPPPFDPASGGFTSGIRTRSMPDGNGHNELSFDDRSGAERLYLRAERALCTEAVFEHSVAVGTKATGNHNGEGYYRETIATDKTSSIGRDVRIDVGRHLETAVSGHAESRVRGNVVSHVYGTSYSYAHGMRHTETSMSSTEVVDRDMRLVVGRDYDVAVSGNAHVIVEGHSSATTLGDQTASVGGSHATSAAIDLMLEAGRTIRIACGPSAIILSKDGVTVEGPSLVFKSTGEARIEIPDAHVALRDAGVDVEAKGTVVATSDKRVELVSQGTYLSLSGDDDLIDGQANSVALTAQSSSLELGSNATLIGAQVHLNPETTSIVSCSGKATPEALKTSWVDVELATDDGAPVPGAKFLVKMSNNEELVGVLDGNGRCRVPIVPGACSIAFPDYDASAWK